MSTGTSLDHVCHYDSNDCQWKLYSPGMQPHEYSTKILTIFTIISANCDYLHCSLFYTKHTRTNTHIHIEREKDNK